MFRVTHFAKHSLVVALSAMMLSTPAIAEGFGRSSAEIVYVGGKKFNFHVRGVHPHHRPYFAPKSGHHIKKHRKRAHKPHVHAGHKRKLYKYHPHRSFRGHRHHAFKRRHGFRIRKH